MRLFSLFRRTPNPAPNQPGVMDVLPDALGSQAVSQLPGRYCRLLMDDPEPETLVAAWNELEKHMTIVPGGETMLSPILPDLEQTQDAPAMPGSLVSVEAFYIDRHAVTNDEFAHFVADGGYSQPELWPPEAVPHLLQFVDRSGSPGPQFWSKCRPPTDRGQHPVVGVCWYEALAYARWSGKRLLTPGQWQWAGVWSSDGGEKKYPWGKAFDPARSNTWSSGVGDTVPVDQYYDGSTPNGVYQLVGNVWEWVSAPLDEADGEDCEQLAFDRSLAEIRGGAFDTYLETQASCLFRSCQPLLYRGTNVGFRCCIPVADLPAPPDPSAFV